MTNWVRACNEPFDIRLERGAVGEGLENSWKRRREGRTSFAQHPHPFVHQGSGKTYSYKLFTELAHNLTKQSGRWGLLVPSGLYTDNGTRALRELLLNKSHWDYLFSFENRQHIFPIDERFKFASIVVSRELSDSPVKAAFMVHDLAAWERTEPPTFPIDRNFISITSPRNMAVLEVRSQDDLTIFLKIYSRSTLMGDSQAMWPIEYARELNMVDDSRLFPPLERWKEQGYKQDPYDRWIGPEQRIGLPIYEGRHIGQFDPAQKGWVHGKGRSAVWRDIPPDTKRIEPQHVISERDYLDYPRAFLKPKLLFMDVASATNTRSFYGCVVPSLPAIHKAPSLRVNNGQLQPTLVLSSLCNSLTFDYVLRTRLGGLNVGWFVLEECPIPKTISEVTLKALSLWAARLSFIHRRFASEWLKLKQLYPELASKEWKHWWAVTEIDRLRLRVEIDSLCADLYGLDPDDFDWMVRDDPTDPKGFYRVDRQLPFRERLTGLAATAVRALREGKWSAETAASLSNDEFFDLLGIPELTNAQAAQAKGLPGPLIEKRDGCHVWSPESFPADDPRHGWTWDDCWNDAVALLGSEEAVWQYVSEEETPATNSEHESNGFRLKAKKSDSKQGRLF